jgi:hypothetical protein
MKNTLFFVAATLLFSAANAQTDTTTSTDSASSTSQAEAKVSVPITIPDHLKGVTSATLRPEHYLPALGSYRSTRTAGEEVTITLDEENIGIIWIEGLPQGRVKALLRQAPATYKIPAQKTKSGKYVPEGTLHVDPATKELSIFLGKPFNSAEPTSVFAADNKVKGWKFSGQKVETVGAVTTPSAQQ